MDDNKDCIVHNRKFPPMHELTAYIVCIFMIIILNIMLCADTDANIKTSITIIIIDMYGRTRLDTLNPATE